MTKKLPPGGQKMNYTKNRLLEVNARAMPIGKMVLLLSIWTLHTYSRSQIPLNCKNPTRNGQVIAQKSLFSPKMVVKCIKNEV
jgi:hypothetical protein